MRRQVITTADGSKTIQIENWNEQYHSLHGAIQEAKHVYIKEGLLFFHDHIRESKMLGTGFKKPINVLEIGFGTGLNALLTQIKAEQLQVPVNYVGVDAFPVTFEELNQLNYVNELEVSEAKWRALHECTWGEIHHISEKFSLHKLQLLFENITAEDQFDVIFFDAFGARVQPELWTEAIFKIMHRALKTNGVLTTYAAIGSVRRTLKALGFEVERLTGPPGKRHMTRAIKR